MSLEMVFFESDDELSKKIEKLSEIIRESYIFNKNPDSVKNSEKFIEVISKSYISDEDMQALIQTETKENINLLFYLAAHHNRTDILQVMITAGAKFEYSVAPFVRRMAIDEQVQIFQTLFAAGIDLDIQNSAGKTALHYWASRSDSESVQAFIQALVTKVRVSVQNKHGRTLLHLAAESNCSGNVQILIDAEADINAKDHFGMTPLHHAAMHGCTEVVKKLIAAKANVHIKDKFSRTALHLAAEFGYTDIFQELIKAQARIDVQDKAGRTPLHLAVRSGNIKAVFALIDSRAEINIEENERGETPLLIASYLVDGASFFKSFLEKLINTIKNDGNFVSDFREYFPDFDNRFLDENFQGCYPGIKFNSSKDFTIDFNERHEIEDQIIEWVASRTNKNQIIKWIEARYSIYKATNIELFYPIQVENGHSNLTNLLLDAISFEATDRIMSTQRRILDDSSRSSSSSSSTPQYESMRSSSSRSNSVADDEQSDRVGIRPS